MKLEQLLMRTSFLQTTFIVAGATVLVIVVMGAVLFMCWCLTATL